MQIAYPKTNVKLVGFLPGLATLLGVSHQAIDDIALMRALPNMTIIEPSGPAQAAAAVTAAAAYDGPVYLRMERATEALSPDAELIDLEIGKAQVFRFWCRRSLFALWSDGQDQLVCQLAQQCGAVVSAENHSVIGGLGDAISHTLQENDVHVVMRRVGVADTFAEGGSLSYLLNKYGLDVEHVVAAAKEAITRKR